MAPIVSETRCCRSATDIFLKGRPSPPEFHERRIPAIGNTFVAQGSSCQAKRSHSRGICSFANGPIEEKSPIKKEEVVSTLAEPFSDACTALVDEPQPETPRRRRWATTDMSQCASLSPATAPTDESVPTPQGVAESSLPAKHVIVLSQLLDQAIAQQAEGIKTVQPRALVRLLASDDVAGCASPRAPACTFAAPFGNTRANNRDMDVCSVASVVDCVSWEGVTLIVRNLPRHVMQEHILAQLKKDGFSFGTGRLDMALLYAPCVFGGSAGKPLGQGFGFVHANSSDAARALMDRWHQRRVFWSAQDTRVLDISKAHVQGVQANLAQWSQSKTRRIRNSRFQPYVADGILSLESSRD